MTINGPGNLLKKQIQNCTSKHLFCNHVGRRGIFRTKLRHVMRGPYSCCRGQHCVSSSSDLLWRVNAAYNRWEHGCEPNIVNFRGIWRHVLRPIAIYLFKSLGFHFNFIVGELICEIIARLMSQQSSCQTIFEISCILFTDSVVVWWWPVVEWHFHTKKISETPIFHN